MNTDLVLAMADDDFLMPASEAETAEYDHYEAMHGRALAWARVAQRHTAGALRFRW